MTEIPVFSIKSLTRPVKSPNVDNYALLNYPADGAAGISLHPTAV